MGASANQLDELFDNGTLFTEPPELTLLGQETRHLPPRDGQPAQDANTQARPDLGRVTEVEEPQEGARSARRQKAKRPKTRTESVKRKALVKMLVIGGIVATGAYLVNADTDPGWLAALSLGKMHGAEHPSAADAPRAQASIRPRQPLPVDDAVDTTVLPSPDVLMPPSAAPATAAVDTQSDRTEAAAAQPPVTAAAMTNPVTESVRNAPGTPIAQPAPVANHWPVATSDTTQVTARAVPVVQARVAAPVAAPAAAPSTVSVARPQPPLPAPTAVVPPAPPAPKPLSKPVQAAPARPQPVQTATAAPEQSAPKMSVVREGAVKVPHYGEDEIIYPISAK